MARRIAGAVLAGAVLAGAVVPPATAADRPLGTLPADGPLRIVAFGTSLTASNAWPDRLQARLAACLDRPVGLTRVAAPGMGSAWGLTRLDRVIAADPDLVLVEFVINDADILDGMSVRRSRATHVAILDALQDAAPKAQVLLMTMNPVTGLVRRLQRPRLAAHDAMLRDLAVARGVGLADLAPRWRAAMDADPGLAPPDGLHPDDAATARVVLPVLAAMIGRAAGATGC